MKSKNQKILKTLKASFLIVICLQITASFALTIWPSDALAADPASLEFNPQIRIPGSSLDAASVDVAAYDPKTGKMNSDLIGRYIQAFYNYGMAAAGILAAIVLMAGGVLWLTSGGDSGKVGQAKELIIGSIIGTIILFSSWIILNTVNPELLKLKTIETIAVKKTTFTSCCQYPTVNGILKGDAGVSKEDCEQVQGRYYDIAKLIVDTDGKNSFCVDTGCCKCKIGGSISTFWISGSTCIDINSGVGKVLPDTCETACEAASKIKTSSSLSPITPSWETYYGWGQVCKDGKCAWSTGGTGGSW